MLFKTNINLIFCDLNKIEIRKPLISTFAFQVGNTCLDTVKRKASSSNRGLLPETELFGELLELDLRISQRGWLLGIATLLLNAHMGKFLIQSWNRLI